MVTDAKILHLHVVQPGDTPRSVDVFQARVSAALLELVMCEHAGALDGLCSFCGAVRSYRGEWSLPLGVAQLRSSVETFP